MNKLIFGADPEFFCSYTKKGDDYCLPPIIFRRRGFKFEKNETHPIFLRASNGQILHEDGAAFEMTVSPSSDWEALFDNINLGIREFEEVLSPWCERGEHITRTSTIKWEVNKWKRENKDFHWSTRFGCDPDRDLFNYSRQCEVEDAKVHPYRYAGGHIHISGIKEIEQHPLHVLKVMVLTGGLASVAFSPNSEADRLRTYRYGKPGKYRIQEYKDGSVGVEYRTPSTTWTTDKNMAKALFESIQFGMYEILPRGGTFIDEILKELETSLVETIVSFNQDRAKELLSYVLSK